jgi:hypothetical protein
VRLVMSREEGSLEFPRGYYEGEYAGPSTTFTGVKWDDV